MKVISQIARWMMILSQVGSTSTTSTEPQSQILDKSDMEKYTTLFRGTSVTILPIDEFNRIYTGPSQDAIRNILQNIDDECPICCGSLVKTSGNDSLLRSKLSSYQRYLFSFISTSKYDNSDVAILVHKDNPNTPHCFHYGCLKKATDINPTCPICRKEISLKVIEAKIALRKIVPSFAPENITEKNKKEILKFIITFYCGSYKEPNPSSHGEAREHGSTDFKGTVFFFLEDDISLEFLGKIISLFDQATSEKYPGLLKILSDVKEIKKGSKSKKLTYQIQCGIILLQDSEITTELVADELFKRGSVHQESLEKWHYRNE